MIWFRVALAWMLLSLAKTAPAQVESANQVRSATTRIDVTLVGAAGQGEEMDALLRSWLAAAPADVAVHRRAKLSAEDVLGAASEPGTLQIWMVLASQRRARLYFSDSSDQRYLVRDVPLRDGLDELGRELVAQVLISSIQSFGERALSSSPSEVKDTFLPEPPAPLPPPPAQPRPSSSPSVAAMKQAGAETTHYGFGLAYSAVARGGEGLGHGPGLYLGLLAPVSDVEGTLTLRLGYRFPIEQRSERIALSTRAIGTHLAAGLQSQLSNHVSLRGEVGLGVEYLSFTPRSLVSEEIETRGKGHDLRPFALGAGRFAWALSNWELAALLTVNLPLVRTHYDLVRGGEQQVELSPWRLQPGLGMELGWR